MEDRLTHNFGISKPKNQTSEVTMAKFNLNKPIMGIDGKAIVEGDREIKIGETLAALLMQTGEGDTLRHYDLAVEARKESSELKPADLDYIKGFIKEKMPRISHAIKAPILKELMEQERAPTA